MDPLLFHKLFTEARAGGMVTLAAFVGMLTAYEEEGRKALLAAMGTFPGVAAEDRNVSPRVAAERLGIAVRKLTRERFTTYRHLCVPIEGQTRGYVVNERALTEYIARQRAGR